MTQKYDMPTHFPAVLTAPAMMLLPERLVLYSLIFGTRPKRYVEVGSFKAGSTVITCAAMDDVGEGRIIAIEPNPQIEPETLATISHRTELIQGLSPDSLPRAVELAGGPFDFAFIDGFHEAEGVMRDIEGVMSCLADRAYLLFHDCHYHGVKQAINEAVRLYSSQLQDLGNLSLESVGSEEEQWGGMRLLLFMRDRSRAGSVEADLAAAQEQLRLARRRASGLEHGLRVARDRISAIEEELRLARDRISALESELRLAHDRISAMENSRTWRLGQRLACSLFGRSLRWVEGHMLRRNPDGHR